MEERLQKYLAHAGVASRRKAEELIVAGRVRVNGQVAAELGMRIDPERDFVKLDGKNLRLEKLVYVLMNKPKGYICSLDDPGHRPKVTDLLKGLRGRVYPVGRLDYDTTGALLLTNDGELANELIHPKHGVQRTYLAKVKGVPTPARIEKLRKGVHIDGRRTMPARVRVVAVKERTSMLSFTLSEGRNRQVKKMCLAVGHPCMRLTRVAFGFLTVSDLASGAWRLLAADEVKRLKAVAAKSAGKEDRQGGAPAGEVA